MDFYFEIVVNDKIKRYFCTTNSYFVFFVWRKIKNE